MQIICSRQTGNIHLSCRIGIRLDTHRKCTLKFQPLGSSYKILKSTNFNQNQSQSVKASHRTSSMVNKNIHIHIQIHVARTQSLLLWPSQTLHSTLTLITAPSRSAHHPHMQTLEFNPSFLSPAVFPRPPPFKLLAVISIPLTRKRAKMHQPSRTIQAKQRSSSWPPKRTRWPKS